MEKEVKVFRFGTFVETIKVKTRVGELLQFAGEMFRVFEDEGLYIDIEDHTVGGMYEPPRSNQGLQRL